MASKALKIDSVTGLLYTVKRPSPEILTLQVDFKRILSGISSVTSVTPQPRGLTSDTTTLTISNITSSGTSVIFDVENGTDQEDYEIQIVVVDSTSRPKVDDILVKCRIPGTEWT